MALNLGGIILARLRNYICPDCKFKTGVDIVYGFPGLDMALRSESGEIVLGGCIISFDDPERRCLNCGHEWRIRRRLTSVGAQRLAAT